LVGLTFAQGVAGAVKDVWRDLIGAWQGPD
jgi:hypothetical protein